jgi:hypothetical protein
MSITKTQARKIAVETITAIATDANVDAELRLSACHGLLDYANPYWRYPQVPPPPDPVDSPADEEGA